MSQVQDRITIKGAGYCPLEIEQTVSESHDACRSTTTAAFASAVHGDESLVIVQEVDDSVDFEPDAVIASIRSAVSSAHSLQPAAIALVQKGSLIDRESGREAYEMGSLSVVKQWASAKPAVTSAASQQAGAQSLQDIQDWLMSEVSKRLGIPIAEIDPTEPLDQYGLESLDAVELTADLEDWLERSVPPMALYDHPTVESLSQFLASGESSAT
jgi:acyl carrier protein